VPCATLHLFKVMRPWIILLFARFRKKEVVGTIRLGAAILAKELSDDQKAELRKSTLESAVVLIDDLAHIREILAEAEPTAGDIRRLTAQLRRILIERDLALIAAPRVGRIFLQAPDIKPIVTSNRAAPIPFFSAGGAEVFGIHVAAALLEKSNGVPRPLPGYDPEARVLLKVDNFLTQTVVCFDGEWVSRGDLIKFIANVAHGIHTGSIKESSVLLIRRVRHAWKFQIVDGQPIMSSNMAAVFSTAELPANIDRKAIDCALLEVLAAASRMVKSPDVTHLEALIEAEVA
jgi:hypothetical protein